MKKIKLDLFTLKARDDLINIRDVFNGCAKRWFQNDGAPNKNYFHVRPCPFCKNSKSSRLYKIDGFEYHRCHDCQSIYTKPHLKDGVLDALYTDGTYQVYQDKLVKKGIGIRKGVLEKRKFDQVKTWVQAKKPRLLDVGCGGGTFMEVCVENNWDVEGVDPSPASGEELKLNIKHGDFTHIEFSGNFDVVTFWGVLEHLSDPVTALVKAEKLLKPGGIMVFEVPSADCLLCEYLQSFNFSPTRYIESGRHNIFFSRNFIDQIAARLNLSILLIETNGLDVQTILMEEFDQSITDKILNIQDTLNNLMLGDHYRVFLQKAS